ncbi:P22 phage major capsid protein family protein [Gordonia terrae]
MAHAFLNPSVMVNTSLGVLERDLVLPSLMWRDAEPNFQGAVGPAGDKVTIRLPGRTGGPRELAWRNSSRTIVTDDIKEGSIEIKLDTYLYKAVDLLDEELTLDIEPFGERVLLPITRSVAEGIEDRLADEIEGAAYLEEIVIAPTDRGVYNALIDARQFLNRHHVPREGRVAIIGSAVESQALKDPTLVDVDRSGSTSALREASIGRIAGFDLFGTDNINPNAIYVFHRTAFPAVFRAPKPARGVPFAASASFAGVALTYWEDYNSVNASDRAFVGTFFGSGVNLDPVDPTDPSGAKQFVRGVKLTLATESTYAVSFGGATGGNATLTFRGKTTGNIAHNASAATVKSALVAIDDNVDADDVTVTGSSGSYTVTVPGSLSGSGASLTGGTGLTVTLNA